MTAPRSPSRAARRIAQGKRPAPDNASEFDQETAEARQRLCREDIEELNRRKIEVKP